MLNINRYVYITFNTINLGNGRMIYNAGCNFHIFIARCLGNFIMRCAFSYVLTRNAWCVENTDIILWMNSGISFKYNYAVLFSRFDVIAFVTAADCRTNVIFNMILNTQLYKHIACTQSVRYKYTYIHTYILGFAHSRVNKIEKIYRCSLRS